MNQPHLARACALERKQGEHEGAKSAQPGRCSQPNTQGRLRRRLSLGFFKARTQASDRCRRKDVPGDIPVAVEAIPRVRSRDTVQQPSHENSLGTSAPIGRQSRCLIKSKAPPPRSVIKNISPGQQEIAEYR
jgi:hypothetical protein